MKLYKPISPYGKFVQQARAGGTVTVKTFEQAKKIIESLDNPVVVKIFEFEHAYQFDYLKLCEEAEHRGIWVICGAAEFLEPNEAEVALS